MILLALLLCVSAGYAEVLRVPADYNTIQSALDATGWGDTVVVSAGRYHESLLAPSHDVTVVGTFLYHGKSDSIDSCIVYPNTAHNPPRIFRSQSTGGQPLLRLIGLTLRGETHNTQLYGGGIEVYGRRLEVRDCRLDSTFSFQGGAVHAVNSTVTLLRVRVRTTGAANQGQLICLDHSTGLIDDCEFDGTSQLTGEAHLGEFRLIACHLHIQNSSIHHFGWLYQPCVFVNPHPSRAAFTLRNCEIHHNRMYRFFGSWVHTHDDEATTIRLDSCQIRDNQFGLYFFSSEEYDPGTVLVLRHNVFEDNTHMPAWGTHPLFIMYQEDRVLDAEHNVFLQNHMRSGSVAALEGIQLSNVNFRYNYVLANSNNSIGDRVGGALILNNAFCESVRENVFIDNIGYAAYSEPFPGGWAIDCYWGHPSGPWHPIDNPDGLGDRIDAGILATPWHSDTSFLASPSSPRAKTPTDFVIGFAYPNPFNSEITIEFVVTRELAVRLGVYDLLGREVETLYEGTKSIGIHRFNWSGQGHASGIYFAKLESADSPQEPWLKKLVLLK